MTWHAVRGGRLSGPRASRLKDIRRRSARGKQRAFLPTCERMEDRTLLASMLWTNAAGGDWDVASNWVDQSNSNDHHVPTASDDAAIDMSGITVTHMSSTADAVNSLTSEVAILLSSGSLAVATTANLTANLTLSGGSIIGGTWTTTGGAELVGTASGGTLNGVTANGDLDLSQVSGASLTVYNGLVLNGTMYLGKADGSTAGYVQFGNYSDPAGSLIGNASVVFGGSSGNALYDYSAQSGTAGTLTIGPNVTIHGQDGYIADAYGTATILNQGTINADTAGGTISLNGFTNAGTIEATAGTLSVSNLTGNLGTAVLSGSGSGLSLNGTSYVVDQGLTAPAGTTLTLGGTWTNAADSTIGATGATLNLGDASNAWTNAGTITASNATVNLGGSFTLAALGTFQRTGVTINLTGTLDDTGTTLSLDTTSGSWNLVGGTIENGTISESGGALLIPTSSGGTLNGVTVNGDLDLSQNSGASLTVYNGLVLNGTMYLGKADGSTAGYVYFGDYSDPAGSLTGNATVVFGGSGGNTLYDYSAQSGTAGTLTIGPNVTIHGQDGYIADAYGTATILNQGTINADTAGGTISLNGFTNAGTIEATAGTLSVSNLTGNLGTAILSGSGSALSLNGTSYVVDQGLTAPARTTLTLGGTWTNAAGSTIVATGATLNLGDASNAWTNAGTITATNTTVTATNTTVNLGGSFTLAALGTFQRTGVTINLTGTLDDTGTTLSLDTTSGSWNLVSGTIENGTISESGGALLIPTRSGGTLNGVTVNGDLALSQNNDANLTVSNGLVLNGTMYLGSADASTSGSVFFGDYGVAAGSLTGNATVVFGSSSSNGLYNSSGQTGTAGTLTIGPSVTIHGDNGTIDSNNGYGTAPIVNQGTINADTAGGTIYLGYNDGAFTSVGTLEATAGTLVVSGSVTVNGSSQFASTAIGTIQISGNLVGNITNPSLFTPQGTTTLDGMGTSGSPQLLEAMSQDLGNISAGFENNFAYGTLIVGPNDYVELVDQSDNSPGSGAEAVYTNSLVVPSGSTLDLNGLNLYALNAQVAGSITGGTINNIPEPPTFTADTPPAATVGSPYSYQFQANGTVPITFSATGLPAWAQLDLSTGILSGTPTADGTFDFTVTASNGIAPNSTVDVSLIAQYQPPTFTADTPPVATSGSPYSYQFQANGTLPITFSATGLPNWAQLDPSTGTLSGTPTVDGAFAFTVTASYGIPPNTTVDVSLIVAGGTAATFDIAAGTSFTIPEGNYTGGTTFNVGAGATVTIDSGTFTGGAIFNLGTGAVVNIIDSPSFSGTLTGGGGGTVQVGDGRLYVGNGGLTLNFAGSIFQWTSGQMDVGNGNLTNLSRCRMNDFGESCRN